MFVDMKLTPQLFKALSNQTRLDILRWLKDPEREFTVVSPDLVRAMLEETGGICVGEIVDQAGLSQSTVSTYLKELQSVGLLTSVRRGRWTYYKRNEKSIAELATLIGTEL